MCIHKYSLTYNSDILRQRTRDVEVKKYCISLLDKYGSFSYTRKTLESLDAEARAEIQRLGGNPLMESVLDGLLSWKADLKTKIVTAE